MRKLIPALTLIAGALALSAAMGPLSAASNAGASDEPAPQFSGVWVRTGEPMFDAVEGTKDGKPIARLQVDSKDAEEIMAGNWENPILQPWAKDIVRKNAESEINLKHVFQADDSCWPVIPPAILNMREAVQFLQAKDRITILYQRDHQVRHIYLNQNHSAKAKPSWYGESVGHFEGDTLVVDTTNFKTHAMSMVDPFGTPHTDKLHVVERYRVIMDQRGTNAWHLVGAYGRAHPAAADGYPAFDHSRGHRISERDDEVRIVIIRSQLGGPEIDHFVPGVSQACEQTLFQVKPAVIGSDSHLHTDFPLL